MSSRSPWATYPRAAARVGVAVLLAVSLGGCAFVAGVSGDDESGSPSPVPLTSAAPSGTTPAPPAPDLGAYYDQRLSWRACGKGSQCTQVEVPLDYADPEGARIELALLRRRATGDRRLGSLLVNPGGPGGSGVQYAARSGSSFSPTVRAAFDIVGFDPRGVGRSNPVDCLTDDELDEFVASDPDPDTPAEEAESRRLLRDFGEGCLERSGDLARHMSTEEAARDVDVLRAVLGDRKLSWFGASYGTFLGATYAELFPGRVGRMVLDGALDPSVDTVELGLTQTRGFETATQAYLRGCVADGACPLGDTPAAAEQGLIDLLDSIDARPLPAVGPRDLEIGNAVLGVWVALYSKDYWPYLDSALEQAQQGQGSALLALGDAYVSRGPNGYTDNSNEALLAVNCLDHDDGVPFDEVEPYVPRFEKISQVWGRIFAYGLPACEEWPVTTGSEPEEIHASGAAPIMVVGTTRDPATPMTWARALADQLDSGVLVVREGDGHTGYRAGNDCVDQAVDAYLVSGTVPDGTVRCPAS